MKLWRLFGHDSRLLEWTNDQQQKYFQTVAIFEVCGETYDNPTKFRKNRSLDRKPG